MAANRNRLELTWIGKDERPRLEPRILLEDSELSYAATHRVAEDDIFDNRLIFGDNLLALKALEQEFAGKVKCIYIDPPFNTGQAFEQYDDGVEHSLWLSLMRDRLNILRGLLATDGSIWAHCDDNEQAYLKVLLDEVFGRENFVATIVWVKADSPRNSARQFSTDQDYILVYSLHPEWQPRKLARTAAGNSIYGNPDDDARGPWLPSDPYANKPYSRGLYELVGPTGRVFSPPRGRFWRTSKEKMEELDRDGRIWWGPTGAARPSIKRYLSDVSDLVPRTLWSADDVGSNRTSKNETRALFPDSPFDTPKPEALMQRVIEIATEPNELVLDSFAGSGTTGAVAHKMRRRWIMVELGAHAYTHIVPRLKQVIDGTDQGGISRPVGWQGGGGFRYLSLAPSLLDKDRWGNWVISKQYNAAMLSEAVCKHEGFKYAPSDTVYWQHGYSTERDFIFVTTQTLTHDQLERLNEEVGESRSLLVCSGAFRGNPDHFPNLTLERIPSAVLKRCEWGRDDYSLKIASVPQATTEPEASHQSANGHVRRSTAADGQLLLDQAEQV